MTSDISKLVKLTSLYLAHNCFGYIPEAISCLQQLTFIKILGSPVKEVPSGLANLTDLACLEFCNCGPLRLPHNLQVSDSDHFGRLT